MIPWKPLGKYSLRGKKKKKRATYSDLKFLIVHFLEILCYLMIKFIYSDQGSHSFESLAKVLKFWRTFIGLEKVWKKFDLACLGLEKVWNLSESKNYQTPPKKKTTKLWSTKPQTNADVGNRLAQVRNHYGLVSSEQMTFSYRMKEYAVSYCVWTWRVYMEGLGWV